MAATRSVVFSDHGTLLAILRKHASHTAAHSAYTFLDESGAEAASVTYAELDRRARSLASLLQQRGLADKPSLLLYPPGIEFLVAFFACFYARSPAIPAPAPEITSLKRTVPRLRAIIEDAGAPVVLCTSRVLELAAASFAGTGAEWLPTDDSSISEQASHSGSFDESTADRIISPDSLAFLQYTSGSTSSPRGVMVSHRNLVAQCRALAAAAGYGDESVAVNWMPHFHDYGLVQGLLLPLFVGIPCYLMSPVAFLRKPIRWLKALSDYRGTHSQAPNFAYDYCARNISPAQRKGLNLGNWQAAGVAAEPIHRETLRRFVTAFGPCGFRETSFVPGYGLAEATLAVSTCSPGEGPASYDVADGKGTRGRGFIGCGRVIDEMQTVIVQPEARTVCGPEEVGEVWIRGPSVSSGYWNRPAETQELFQAFLGDTGEGPFFRTGDLGFFRAREFAGPKGMEQHRELVITGRIKDLIIVSGENHYPQDIERNVEDSDPSIRPNGCAAFALNINGEERVAVAAELKGRCQNPRETVNRIRMAVAGAHDLDVHTVALLRSGGLPRTSSGKVQRSACREALLANSLESVLVDSRGSTRAVSTDPLVETSAWLRERIAGLIGADSLAAVDPELPFSALGLVSRHAVQLAAELEARAGRSISPVAFYEFPTLRAFSKFLDQTSATDGSAEGDRQRSLNPAEPIAIVGVACRFPGADSLSSFRELLWGERCAVGSGASERWKATAAASEDSPRARDTSQCRMGLLDQIDRFDASFFGIPAHEASYMDPQQRMLLELAWEALENAGQPFSQLAGSATGVVFGITNSDYSWMLFRDRERTSAFAATGSALSIAANRIAYFFDFCGPATVIDTACSSSLVAVHSACQSLRSGECSMALAGGASVILTPEWTAAFSQAGMISPDGVCKTFDAGADGYVRGEGCGVVVLKRLSEAQRAGDRILGTILGSAVNQDGRSNGLTAPNPVAQERVIRRALEMGKVEPGEVQYVEAHGTGTPLGDPIEVRALNRVLGEGREKNSKLRIGSVKTNIGHLEAAAGIAGLIKVVLALGEEMIPPQLHFKEPNPHIDWEGIGIEVVSRAVAWRPGRRIAGVSSFGFGGTNAHVVLEGPPVAARELELPADGEVEATLAISAKTAPALEQLVQRYAEYLQTTQDRWVDICYTAERGRARFEHSLTVRARSARQAGEKLLRGEVETGGAITGGSTENDGATGNGATGNKVALPSYPFQRRRHWIPEGRGGGGWLGKRIPTAGREAVFEGTLSAQQPVELGEHRVLGRVVLPGSGHLAMVLYAAREVWGEAAYELEEVTFREALRIPDESSVRVQVVLSGEGFEVCSAETRVGEVSWKVHSSGKVRRMAPGQVAGDTERVKLPEGAGETAEPLRQAMAEAGYELGAGFQWIERIWTGREETWARMRVAAEQERPERAALHPGLLDACLQAVAGAVMGRGEQLRAYMPIHVERVLWYGGQWEYLWSRVVLQSASEELLRAEVQVVDEAGRMVCRLEGLSVKRATPEAIDAAPWRNWLYRVEWRLQPPLTSVVLSGSTQFRSQRLSEPSQIALRLQNTGHSTDPTLEQAEQLWPELERLSLWYASRAVRKFEGNTRRVASEQSKLWTRVLEMDAEANLIRGYVPDIHLLNRTYPAYATELGLLTRCGENLAEVLEGKVQPLQLLFPEAPFPGAEQLYERSPVARALNQRLKDAVQASVESMPSRPLQVLEIGGGTGASTAYVLDALLGFAISYVFTDVSSLFLAKARNKFGTDVTCERLDIERNPDGQGFAGRRFDLIVAAQVLHATRDLSETLRHVRQLLAPGGLLLLSEGTEPQRWVDLTFGMTQGWWRFEDTAIRPRHPLQGAPGWETLLKRTGFAQARAIAAGSIGPLKQQAIVAAGGEVDAGRWLILGDRGGAGAELAGRLQASGQETEVIPRGAESLESILQVPYARVVHMWSLDSDSLDSSSDDPCRSALELVQALARAPYPPRLWLVTRGAQPVHASDIDESGVRQSTVGGLGNVVAREHPEFACRRIDLDPAGGILGLFEEIAFRPETHRDEEDRVALRGGLRYVPRVVPVTSSDESRLSNGAMELTSERRGTLDRLKWIRRTPDAIPDLGADEVEIDVRATGLNFLDVMDALGQLPFERDWFGAECSGVIASAGRNSPWKKGEPVFAIAPGAFTTRLRVESRFVARKPRRLSFAEAAALPVAFLSAQLALVETAHIGATDSVLIHAAAGGVGLAAVGIAQSAGAEIFATAGTAEKRAYLESLGVRCVMNSRSLDFAEEIMRRTHGRGVSIVLNSLAGEFIPASLGVLATGGRFLELGKTGIWTEEQIARHRGDISYSVIALNETVVREPARIAELLQRITDLLGKESLQVLPVQSFPAEQTVEAFRTLQRARHIGKIVVTWPDSLTAALTPLKFSAGKTYAITGGAGGLGLLVAGWLVDRGARHLLLIGRSAPSEAAVEFISELERRGATVQTPLADVSLCDEIAAALDRCGKTMPPLGGVIQAAGLLDDGVIVQQTWNRFQSVLAPKVRGTWNLHELTRDLPLDFFVMFSSLASVLGTAGQASHVAANAFLDSFAHFRQSRGLPALSINWGAWGSRGAAARKGVGSGVNDAIGLIPPSQGREVLSRLFEAGDAQVAVSPMERLAVARVLGGDAPLISEMAHRSGFVEGARSSGNGGSTLRHSGLASGREGVPENAAQILPWLHEEVSQLLGLAPSVRIEPGQPLHEFGLDSLMALELRNRLAERLRKPLPATLLFDYPTVSALTGYLTQELAAPGLARSSGPAPIPSAVGIEPIAVIGVGCRFPGASLGPQAFWEFLTRREDAISEVPASRWDVDAYYDPDPDATNRMNSRYGAFVDEVDRFDAAFFGISPREASVMDPQQRLLLETAWHAIEHAGLSGQSLTGSQTGVFIGVSTQDYLDLLNNAGVIDNFRATGNAGSVAAGRLSYVLGLQGPSVALDTACSSSLVAVHLACQSLRAGECEMALAGGVNLVLSPTSMLALSTLRMLAPDGRCKTFDAGADGYVRGEGCGVVVLKRLSEAQRAGDRILGTILGSAVNQDGRSSGLTAPNGPAQERVIRRALEMGKVEPGEVQYVEAHGTGTPLGDPIEVRALNRVLGEGREKNSKLRIGSVKTNIGHLEAAAGIAGLIKVVLALGEEMIPPQLHFKEPNPHIDWEGIGIEVVSRAVAWRPGRRIAGVSSFGFGGTNAHVVLEGPPVAARELELPADGEVEATLAISAKTAPALEQLVQRYAEYLQTTQDRWVDICYTAERGRARFEHSLTVRARSARQAGEKLLRGEVETGGAITGGSTENDGATGNGATGNKVALPSYPFQRRRHWIPEGRGGGGWLGKRIPTAGREAVFEGTLSAQQPVELGEHRVLGRVVLPGSGHLAMVLYAAREVWGEAAYELEEVTFREALRIPDESSVRVQVVLSGEGFEVCSAETRVGEVSWKVHSSGKVRRMAPGQVAGDTERVKLPEGAGETAEPLRQAMAEAGYELGAGFQWIERIWTGREETWARMRVAAEQERPERAALHPGLLDACLQAVAGAVMGRGEQLRAYMPIHVERVLWYGGQWEYLWSRVVLQSASEELLRAEVQVVDEAGRMVCRLEGLSVKRATPEAIDAAPWRNWLYRVEWRLQPHIPASAVVPGARRWLILADRNGAASQLAEQLIAAGQRVVTIPSGRDSLATALERSSEGVVHLGSLDEPSSGCRDVLELVQKLAQIPGRLPRLWLVTRGAQTVHENDPLDAGLAQAPLWGLANVIAREHPEFSCTRIDLDPRGSSDGLFNEIAFPSSEDQVALRSGLRYVPRLTREARPRAASDSETGFSARPDGTYLITGAFGGLGLVLADWLADHGVRRLLLVGRQALSPGPRSQLLNGLMAKGTHADLAVVDVSQESEVREVLQGIPADYPLRGIFHAAGTLDDGVLLQQSWSRFQKVMAPKVDGSWHLHCLSRELPLDYFVLFSSAASLLGSPGQGNHAAANAFLDALAHRRKAMGLPAMSIDWGAWAETGAAAHQAARKLFADMGVGSMPPDLALRAMECIMKNGSAQAVVLPIDWRRLADRSPGRLSPLLSDLVRHDAVVSHRGDLRSQLNDVPVEDRPRLLNDAVKQQVRTVLGLDPQARIDSRLPLGELGLDSLLALELSRSLGATVGIRLSATLLFDYPTVESLVGFLSSKIFKPAPLTKGLISVPPGDGIGDDPKNDEEVHLSLLQELARSGY